MIVGSLLLLVGTLLGACAERKGDANGHNQEMDRTAAAVALGVGRASDALLPDLPWPVRPEGRTLHGGTDTQDVSGGVPGGAELAPGMYVPPAVPAPVRMPGAGGDALPWPVRPEGSGHAAGGGWPQAPAWAGLAGLLAAYADWDMSTMLRIVGCESTDNPDAVSPDGRNWGLMQINVVNWDGDPRALLNPATNIAAAHGVWLRQGYAAWSCY